MTKTFKTACHPKRGTDFQLDEKFTWGTACSQILLGISLLILLHPSNVFLPRCYLWAAMLLEVGLDQTTFFFVFHLFRLLFFLVKVFLIQYSGSTLLPRGTQVGRVLHYCSFTSWFSNIEHHCSTEHIVLSPHSEDSSKVTSDTRLLLR